MVRSGPNKSELARLLLDWEVLERNRIVLEEEIKDAVMQVGETVEVGNVRATYIAAHEVPAFKGIVDNHIVKYAPSVSLTLIQ